MFCAGSTSLSVSLSCFSLHVDVSLILIIHILTISTISRNSHVLRRVRQSGGNIWLWLDHDSFYRGNGDCLYPPDVKRPPSDLCASAQRCHGASRCGSGGSDPMSCCQRARAIWDGMLNPELVLVNQGCVMMLRGHRLIRGGLSPVCSSSPLSF